RRVGATLDISGKQFDARQQTANPAHVRIAVPTDLVADAVEDQSAVLQRLQGFQAFLESEGPCLVRPESGGYDAVGAEHHAHPLLAPLLVRETETRQVQDEWQGRRADSQVADEFASRTVREHVTSPFGIGRTICWRLFSFHFRPESVVPFASGVPDCPSRPARAVSAIIATRSLRML